MTALTTSNDKRVRDVLERYEAAVRLLPELPAVEQRWALFAAVLVPRDARLRHMRADAHLTQTTQHEGGQ